MNYFKNTLNTLKTDRAKHVYLQWMRGLFSNDIFEQCHKYAIADYAENPTAENLDTINDFAYLMNEV